MRGTTFSLFSVAVLRIRDILVWIRILGSVPLTNGSVCGSGRPQNIRPDPEHWFIYIIILLDFFGPQMTPA